MSLTVRGVGGSSNRAWMKFAASSVAPPGRWRDPRGVPSSASSNGRLALLNGVLPASADLDAGGRLRVGGCALEDLAGAFGTPAFVVDEHELRRTARAYVEAFASWHADTRICFATKAFPCAPVARVVAEEGLD